MERLNIKSALSMALQIRGRNKEYLAKQGISSRTLANIEKGDVGISTITIERIADIFNMKPLHFLQLADMNYITVASAKPKKRGEV